MKNIHVLPTDKPSRLHKIGNEWALTYNANSNPFAKQKNIYITNDDKFVKDEYITDGIEVIQASSKLVNAQGFNYQDECKKIILTTDQELIKDGVQAIDDEFLEWFVKNPSCESIEINILCYGALSGYADAGYKIIIPKEEPKQVGQITEKGIIDIIGNCANCGVEFHIHKDIQQPKQETLEEAALIYASKPRHFGTRMTFIDGAKWQEQQTIEEVFEWLTTNNYLTDLKQTLIENFKNK